MMCSYIGYVPLSAEAVHGQYDAALQGYKLFNSDVSTFIECM